MAEWKRLKKAALVRLTFHQIKITGREYDMSTAAQREKAKLAGLVLGLMGCFSYGATSPFGLVLNAEWIRDPDRRTELRSWDIFGLVLCIPGTAYFLFFTIALFDYSPGGGGFGPMLSIYWIAFVIWLGVRLKTRWRDISARRQSKSVMTTKSDSETND